MKNTIKLTPAQIQVLEPLVINKNKAEATLGNAILLIVGKEFTGYSIANGELVVNFPDEFHPVVTDEVKEN